MTGFNRRCCHGPVASPAVDGGTTVDDLREAVTTLEDAIRIARRVFGAAHPLVEGFEGDLQDTRAALRARETPPVRGA